MRTQGALNFFICLTIILTPLALVEAGEVGSLNRRANRLFNQEKYEEALQLYEEALQQDPADPKLMMNRGSALHRLDRLEEAEEAYLDALSSKLGRNAQADAHYNLGNTLFRQGERLELDGNAAAARGKYTQALENYINTLKLRPEDRDAKWNLQLAHEKVELMEQMQDQQQQQGDDENQDQQEQQQQGGGQGDDEQNQEPDRNDQGSDDQNQEQEQEQNQEREQQNQRQEEQERDMRREEAERLIEQFADDEDELRRPQHRGRVRQPEKDW
jgi:tetratricopeptide (TPR) repeat protein